MSNKEPEKSISFMLDGTLHTEYKTIIASNRSNIKENLTKYIQSVVDRHKAKQNIKR